nr:uncharacterized protein LOC106827904 [Equus asinus]
MNMYICVRACVGIFSMQKVLHVRLLKHMEVPETKQRTVGVLVLLGPSPRGERGTGGGGRRPRRRGEPAAGRRRGAARGGSGRLGGGGRRGAVRGGSGRVRSGRGGGDRWAGAAAARGEAASGAARPGSAGAAPASSRPNGRRPSPHTEPGSHSMLRLLMLLAGLGGALASGPGSENSFIQVIFPEKIQANTSNGSEVEDYDYLGSDRMIITNKIIEIIGFVNSMFAQFKVTVVLSSLELWSDKNKVSTVGEADELLSRFSEWKKSYLTLRPHDIAYLFIYKDYPDYVGAAFPGKMCITHYSAGIALACNTLLSCHCEAGYSPPSCEPTPSSPGGSTDDGFRLVEKIICSVIDS